MVNFFTKWFGDRTLGGTRSGQWPKVRKEFVRKNPICAICGKKWFLNVHHVQPFHLNQTLELDENNLITLCRTDHFSWGHFYAWKSFNKDVKIDVERIKNRP